MDKCKLLDMFTGTGSVARVAEDLGYEVHTLDMDHRCKPDICVNILEFDYRSAFIPGYFDVVFASPPCDTFSAARRSNIGRNFIYIIINLIVLYLMRKSKCNVRSDALYTTLILIH